MEGGLRLLVAVDGSECAERAFTRALSLATPHKDTIVLAYVIDAGKFAGAALRKSDSAGALGKVSSELQQQGVALLEGYSKRCADLQVAVASVITESLDAKAEIVRLAEDHKTDLLVMGRRSSSLVRMQEVEAQPTTDGAGTNRCPTLQLLVSRFVVSHLDEYSSILMDYLPEPIKDVICQLWLTETFKGGQLPPAFLPATISALDLNKKHRANEALHSICVSGITRSIYRLNLASTLITDRELALKGIWVKNLNLNACHQLTEEGLQEFFRNVRGLKKLSAVCLRGITNRSINVLVERKKTATEEELPLKRIDFSGCKFITKGGLNGFAAAFPQCKITATNFFA